MWIVGCYLSTVLKDLQTSNICTTLQFFLSGKNDLKSLLLTSFTQLLAGVSGFYLAYGIWSLSLTTAHELRRTSFENGCSNNLPLPVYSAALVEYTGTLADRGLPLLLLTNRDMRLQNWVLVLWNVLITIAGVRATGMFANPVNATTQMFGCSGLTKIEHVFIYWISPLMATLTVFLLFEKRLVKTVKSD